MKDNNFTKRIIQLLIVGGLFMFVLYRSFQTDNIFANFFYLVLGVLEIILLSKVISENYIEFKKSKKNQSLTPTCVAFLIIISNLSLYIYYKNLEDSKTYIHAYGNGLIIDLKEDGKYIIKTGSWGGQTYYYGTYIEKDSIIHLDKKVFGNKKTTGEFKFGKIHIDKQKFTKNALFESYNSKTFENADCYYIKQ